MSNNELYDTEWYKAEYRKKLRYQEQLCYRTLRGELLMIGDTIIFRNGFIGGYPEFRIENIEMSGVTVSTILDPTGPELVGFKFSEELFNDMDPRKAN